MAATAGTARHSLVLEHALRPLFGYLHAVVVPTGVFAATDDFGTAWTPGSPRRGRAGRPAWREHLSSHDPIARRTLEDEFADPIPFELRLQQAGLA